LHICASFKPIKNEKMSKTKDLADETFSLQNEQKELLTIADIFDEMNRRAVNAEDGFSSEAGAYLFFDRIEKQAKAYKARTKEYALAEIKDGSADIDGYTIKRTAGKATYKFLNNPQYLQLKSELDAETTKMKTVAKELAGANAEAIFEHLENGETIRKSTGEQVYPATINYSAETITITKAKTK
jgi:hypothetical protein